MLVLEQMSSEAAQLKYGPAAIPVTLPDLQSQVPDEWVGIIERLVVDLSAMGWNGEVLQVKEKLGELRFYLSPERTEEMWERVCRATEESRKRRRSQRY